MATLVDTNVLLRSLHPAHLHHGAAERAVATLRLQGEVLCVAPQNLMEFWAVATRSVAENGLGMSFGLAAQELATLRRLFTLLPSTPEILEAWQRIVISLGISGKQTHDAHLVAAMQHYSVRNILTFNAVHFKRFPGIGVIDPAQF